MNILNKYPIVKRRFEDLNKHFEKEGYELRLAGGAVRDILLGVEPDDLDFCTTAPPDVMMNMKNNKWFVIPTGLHHGTVSFLNNNMTKSGNYTREESMFEVTTLRRDVVCDGRRAEVEFTDDWKEDASRRDFTINAMMMDINGEVYDFFGGQKDLEDKVVRFVGNADERIKEDALRMLRALRFVARYDDAGVTSGEPCLPEQDLIAITQNVELIKNITVERVWNEYKKMVKGSCVRGMGIYRTLMLVTGMNCELDFPDGTEDHLFYRMAQFDIRFRQKYPAFYIATHIDSLDKAIQFYKKYKLSRIERKQMEFMVKYGVTLEYKDLTYHLIKSLLEQEYDREWIVAICNYHGARYHQDFAEKAPVPVFNVTAQDLMKIDPELKEGRKLGNRLKKVKQSWVDSDYEKTKEELLDEFREQSDKVVRQASA